ncbi:MAG: hypothetical protein ACKVOP_04655 [Sphingomonadaceae bacterium]
MSMHRGMAFFALLALSAPAFAQSSVAIPEPTDLALFALAVVGLIVGRQSSRNAPRDPDDKG